MVERLETAVDMDAQGDLPVSNRINDRSTAAAWLALPTRRIEDLQDAVRGAGLQALQMDRGPLEGSLAFTEKDGVSFTSGRVETRVALSGPLSEDRLTFGLGLRVVDGTWHWYQERPTGSLGLFHPGDEHASLYMPGTLYLTASLSLETLSRLAEQQEVIVNRRTLGGTGFLDDTVDQRLIEPMARSMDRIHADPTLPDEGLCDQLLSIILGRYTRQPVLSTARGRRVSYGQMVSRARSYAEAALHRPISIQELAEAARTTPRTLHRAFQAVLSETPLHFIQRLRLHRIRQALISESEARCTIALVAARWGMREPGRFSGLYRELFGELPSTTRAVSGSQVCQVS